MFNFFMQLWKKLKDNLNSAQPFFQVEHITNNTEIYILKYCYGLNYVIQV
jgi:hypothetical protein